MHPAEEAHEQLLRCERQIVSDRRLQLDPQVDGKCDTIRAELLKEVRQQFSLCFRAGYVSGEPTPGDESSEVRWVHRDDLVALDIHPSMRLRIDHGYEHRAQPYIG